MYLYTSQKGAHYGLVSRSLQYTAYQYAGSKLHTNMQEAHCVLRAGRTLCTSLQGGHCVLVSREHNVYQCIGSTLCTSAQEAHFLSMNRDHNVYQCK